MTVTTYPTTFRFGQPHPDTTVPEGFALVAEDREFLYVREIATGHLFMPEFRDEEHPHRITRLVRYRLPTQEECAACTHIPGGRFILDRAEQIHFTYDQAGILVGLAYTVSHYAMAH